MLLKAQQFLQPHQHQTDGQKKSSMKGKHENTVTNKAASTLLFPLLYSFRQKTCTKSKPVSRKMTHPGHLKEFLQLGKKMQFLVSSSFDFLLLLSLIQPLFFLHAFLPAATLKTFPPSSSTAVDKSRCCCRLLFQGLLALLKDLSTLNPMNFTENHSMASFPGMATLEKKTFQLCSIRACIY